MIVLDRGRWRSVRSKVERNNLVQEKLAALNPIQRQALQKILEEWKVHGRSKLAEQVAQIEWEEQPLPVEEWLLREDIIGETGKDMYPQLRADMVELFSGNYHEVILTGSTAWGKDYFATTATMRVLYELNCMANPQHSLGLAAGEPIHIVPISRTVASARRVVFGGICKKLALAPWFKGKYEETMEEVRFKKKGIFIVGGASSDGAALGLNTILSIVDELNFYGEGKIVAGSASAQAENKAAMVYNALARRIKNRFSRHGVKGMIFLISSKRSTTDFTETRIRKAIKEEESGVFVRDYATWSVHPEAFKDSKWLRCAVSQKEGRCRVLAPNEEAPAGALVFDFPDDYEPEFRADPDGASRDLGGISTDFAGKLFIPRRQFIDQMWDKSRAGPFKNPEWSTGTPLQFQWPLVLTRNAHNEPIPFCCAGATRHVAIDMSTNQCATALAVLHMAGHTPVFRRDPETGEQTREEAPVVHVDALLRVVAPDGGDIDQGEVRSVVYRLIAEGYPIKSVSMDQYCAPPNLQMFQRRGLKAVEMGERVAKLKPYLNLRQAIYEGRVRSPFHPGLEKELKELEMDGDKVKHPKTSTASKDLADALSNGVYYVSQNMRAQSLPAPSMGISVPSGPDPKVQWSHGNPTWPDELPLDDAPPSGNPGVAPPGGGYSSWIV
mgnify:FL=1